MPTFNITGPDGTQYEVTGPEGSTQEQALARVKSGAVPAKPKATALAPMNLDPTEGNSFVQNVAIGAGKNISDTWLGAKQLANSITGGAIGDKAALAAEAAEKARLDKPISATGGGMVGDIGTSVLTSALPMGAAVKGAQAAKFLPSIVRGVLPTAAVGAGQAALTPDEDYSLPKELGTGALAGVAGDVIGRGVGRVLRPMQALIPDAVKQRVAMLPDKMNLLAENITDSPAIRAATNALAQIPGFGGSIVKNREANLGEVTKAITGAAGTEVPALTPQASKALHDRVAGQAERFAQGPDLPVPNMIPALQAAQTAPEQLAARVLGTARPAAQLRSAESALTPRAAPAPAPSGLLGPTGQPLPAPPAALIPPAIPAIPAQDAMNLRRELGDQVFTGEHGISTQGAQTIKDEIEDALRARHGDAFDTWKKEHGASLDVRKIQDAGGVTSAGHIKPEAYVATLPATEVANPTTPLNKMMTAAAQQMPSPSLAENRSLMVRTLMGAPLVAGAGAIGGLTGAGTGSPATGAGVGAGSLGLASLLLGTAGGGRYLTGQNRSTVGKALQSEKAKELARLLGVSTVNEMFQ